MSITIGSTELPAHANPDKFKGSDAYAAPELHQWMAAKYSNGNIDVAADGADAEGTGSDAGSAGAAAAVGLVQHSNVAEAGTIEGLSQRTGGAMPNKSEAASSPLDGLERPEQVDLWSFAVTLYGALPSLSANTP
jgi:hypothetical protein